MADKENRNKTLTNVALVISVLALLSGVPQLVKNVKWLRQKARYSAAQDKMVQDSLEETIEYQKAMVAYMEMMQKRREIEVGLSKESNPLSR